MLTAIMRQGTRHTKTRGRVQNERIQIGTDLGWTPAGENPCHLQRKREILRDNTRFALEGGTPLTVHGKPRTPAGEDPRHRQRKREILRDNTRFALEETSSPYLHPDQDEKDSTNLTDNTTCPIQSRDYLLAMR